MLTSKDREILTTLKRRIEKGIQEFEADAFLTAIVPKLIAMIERQELVIQRLAQENADLLLEIPRTDDTPPEEPAEDVPEGFQEEKWEYPGSEAPEFEV